ncbi:MAG TPA: tetratricopeptide repeat protein, partial [Candidatus Polarisedimenticolaceae bacterium]|nr:tetratricopeptide repeat protein [Candidatus Polarisedimenticolaceae bacterium]
RAKDEAGARAALARALAIDPKARWARYNRALVEEAAGNASAAMADYRAELTDYPDAYKAQFNLARMLEKSGDKAAATEAFRKVVAVKPDWGGGRFYLARNLLEAGDLEGAKSEALKGLDLDARSEFAALGHYVLAAVYERQGQRALAAAEVGKARAIEKN